MKTTITTLLTAICASGLLMSAAAQSTTSGTADDNTAAAAPDQSAPPSEGAAMENTNPPDTVVSPPDASAQVQGAVTGPETAPADQTGTAPADQTGTAPAENQPVESVVILPKGNAPESVPSAFMPPVQVVGTNQNDLNLNFKSAPLDMVLNYLSDAAGFVIVQDTRVGGTVTVVGQHLTKDEVVNLLNTELNRNGYAAVRAGRTLTIMGKNDAKTRNIPVMTGNDPNSIPDNDEIATWIIPIRFVDAGQLVSDLESFVSPQATIVANAAGNSIVITDTQANIHHLAEIIRSVDDSAEAETELRVFALKYASPADVANELTSIFPGSNGAQTPVQFAAGGRGGRGGGNPFAALFGGGGGGGDGGGGTSQQRIQKSQQVNVVADMRIQAVIVTAPKDLMNQIVGMMAELDVPSDRDQNVYAVQLKNGDPNQVAQVLQNMFGGNNSRGGTSSSQNSALMSRTQSSANSMGTTTTSTGIGSTGTGGGGR